MVAELVWTMVLLDTSKVEDLAAELEHEQAVSMDAM
jgi:hypothetical protein